MARNDPFADLAPPNQKKNDPFADLAPPPRVGFPAKTLSPLKIGAPSFKQFADAGAELPAAPPPTTTPKKKYDTAFAEDILQRRAKAQPTQPTQPPEPRRLGYQPSKTPYAGDIGDGSLAAQVGRLARTTKAEANRPVEQFQQNVLDVLKTPEYIGRQAIPATTGMAQPFVEGAYNLLGRPDIAEYTRQLQQKIEQASAPQSRVEEVIGGGMRLAGLFAPYIAAGVTAAPLSISAGLTALQSQAKNNTPLVEFLGDKLDSDVLKRIAASKYKTPAEVVLDVTLGLTFGSLDNIVKAAKTTTSARAALRAQGAAPFVDFGNVIREGVESGALDAKAMKPFLQEADKFAQQAKVRASLPLSGAGARAVDVVAGLGSSATQFGKNVASNVGAEAKLFSNAGSKLAEQAALSGAQVSIPKRSIEPLTDLPTITQEVRSVGDNGFVVLPPQAQPNLAVEREHLARMNMEIEPKIQQLAAPYTRSKEGAGLFFGDVSPNALFRFSANMSDEEIRKAAAIRGLVYGQEAQLWYRPAREGEAGASAAFLASARDGADLSPEAISDILAAASDNGIVGATKDGGKLSFLNIKEYTGLSDEEFNAKMMAAFKAAEVKHDIDIHETNVYSEILNGTSAYIQAIGPTSESLLAARNAIVEATPEYIRYAKAVGADPAVTQQRIAARLAEIDENISLQRAIETGDEASIQQSFGQRLAQDIGPRGTVQAAVPAPALAAAPTPVVEAPVASALAGKTFDVGGALGEGVTALSNAPGGKAQLAKVGLGAVGYGLSQAEDERLQGHGNALMGLAAYSLVHGKVKQGAKAAGAAVAEELAKSPVGRKVLDEISLDIRVDPRVKETVDVAMREMAKYRAIGRELAAEAKKRGGVFDRTVSDLVEKEAVEADMLSPEDMKIAVALAQKVADNSLGLKKVEARLMSADTYAKRGTAYLPRRYAKYDAKDVNDVVVQHKGKTFRIGGEKIRNDLLTREERDALGEIREASYRIADYFGRGSKDIATAHLFEALAEIPGVIHPEYVSAVREAAIAADLSKVARTPTKAYRGSPTAGKDALRAADAAKDRAKGLSEQFKRQGQEYVTLPDTPQLGVLRGAVVRKDAAAYLNDLPDFRSTNRMYNRLMHIWKSAHTVFNVPATHLTNMASNVFMGILGGLPIQEQVIAIPRALKDIQEYGPTTRFLTEAGVIERALPTYGEEPIKGLARDETVLRSMMKTTRPETREALEAQGLKGMSWMEEKARKVGGKIETAYSLGDTMFRVALFDKLTKQGMTNEDALKEIMRVFPGYDTRSPILQKLKHISPFVMYPAKYLPAALDLIAEHPWRWALASASWAAVDQASRRQTGAVREEDLPPNKRFGKLGYLKPGLIQAEALGLKSNEAGKRLMFDMARFTPFTALTGSTAPGTTISAINDNVPALFQPSGPVMDIVARLGYNVDPFSGKPFIKKSDDAMDKLKKFTVGTTEAGRFSPGLAASLLLPSSLSYHLPNIAKDLYYGNAEAAKMSGMGLVGGRPVAVKRGQQARTENYKLQQQIREVNTELQGDLRAARDMVVRRNLIKKAMEKRQRLVEEFRKSRQP